MTRPDADRRDEIDLAGEWELSTSSAEGPQQSATVPGNWFLDGIDGPETVWYRRSVSIPDDWAARQVRLRFGAVDYAATVTWDGSVVGGHTGGFAPFTVAVPAEAGPHELVLRVDCPTDPFGEVWPHTKKPIRGVMGHHDARPGGWTERGQERSSGGPWGPIILTAHDRVAVEAVRVATPVRPPSWRSTR